MAFLIYDLSIAMLLNLWCNKRFKNSSYEQ